MVARNRSSRNSNLSALWFSSCLQTQKPVVGVGKCVYPGEDERSSSAILAVEPDTEPVLPASVLGPLGPFMKSLPCVELSHTC